MTYYIKMAWCLMVILLSSPCLYSQLASDSDGTVVRKNIDALTVEELAAYKHAWRLLRERSVQDRYDTAGYLWQAWIHNKHVLTLPDGQLAHPGPCEHGTTKFLPWHRAQLYFMEKILQSTDPEGKLGPSTKNVAIPFWNFLRGPSGRVFPEAFHDENSPLFHVERNYLQSGTPVFSKAFVSNMVYFYNWLDFGGGPARDPGFGFFELIVHNFMHNWVGGSMSDQSFAALDPIFFSYHAYLDVLFEFWITEHGTSTITDQKYYLRATQPHWVPRPPGYVPPTAGGEQMGRTVDYPDISKLGHNYEVSTEDSLMHKDDLEKILFPTESNTDFGNTSHGRNAQSFFRRAIGSNYPLLTGSSLLTLEQEVDLSEFKRKDQVESAKVYLTETSGLENLNYQVDVYLHPRDSSFDLSSTEDRDRFIAQSISVWGNGAHHNMQASLDLIVPINSIIIGGDNRQPWMVKVVVSVHSWEAEAELNVAIQGLESKQ